VDDQFGTHKLIGADPNIADMILREWLRDEKDRRKSNGWEVGLFISFNHLGARWVR
jgi:hypothetical protein